MYDFIKAVIPAQYKKRLLENPLLEFAATHDDETGELISPKKTAEYKGLKFIVFDTGYIEIQGSIHKFKNDGLHNFDDFYLTEVKTVIKELEQLFRINFLGCRLQNLEFGVNITPPLSTRKVLNNLLFHKNEKFKDISWSKGNYKQAVHQRYLVKVYDKQAQYSKKYHLISPIMRFELKYIKMIDLNNRGITKIGDLLEQEHFENLKAMLLKEWAQILLFDTTIVKKELRPYTKNSKLNQWQNPNYWLELKKQERSKQRRLYKNVVKNHSTKVQKLVSILIEKKWNELAKGVPQDLSKQTA